MSHVTFRPMKIGEIAAKTGLSVRQLQRLARKQDTWVNLKTDGYHHTYRDCPGLRAFIREKRTFRKGRRPEPKKKKQPAKLPVAIQVQRAASHLRQVIIRNRELLSVSHTSTLIRIDRNLSLCRQTSHYITSILRGRGE
jgi:hypothetical protein